MCSAIAVSDERLNSACAAHKEASEMYGALEACVGERVEAETRDGGLRRGVLTRIVWDHVQVDGQELSFPVELQLNNEAGDFLLWRQLLRVRRK